MLLVALRSCLHVRDACRAYGERRSKISLDVRLPLLEHRWIVHAGAILPVRIGYATIVDQDVDATTKETGGLLDTLTYRRDISEIADRGAEARSVVLEMSLSGVLEFFFVDVKDEDLVAVF